MTQGHAPCTAGLAHVEERRRLKPPRDGGRKPQRAAVGRREVRLRQSPGSLPAEHRRATDPCHPGNPVDAHYALRKPAPWSREGSVGLGDPTDHRDWYAALLGDGGHPASRLAVGHQLLDYVDRGEGSMVTGELADSL